MSKATVLVVDDEPSIREVLRAVLESMDLRVLDAQDGESALRLLAEEWCDLLISDVNMPGLDGMGLLRAVREEHPRAKVLLMSAYGTMDLVIEALRLGAVDFMTKPLNHKLLRETVSRLVLEKTQESKANLQPVAENDGVIGTSPALLEALDRARKAASGDASVLVTGESGTGKEVLSRWIHNHSTRSDKPFIALNCGALPENLVESELFGYEKGAFTGAAQAKPGKFELASGGTIFLDEIAELPLLAQVKLLRVLQERTVDRVGSVASRPVDFRMIAATHRDLAQMVREGRFREDLYYRLNVIPLHLPPLRDRGQDVVILARTILERLNGRYGTRFVMDTVHEQQLCTYSWPGNVRELENVLERSVVLSGGSLELQMPIGSTVASSPSTGLSDSLFEIRAEKEREAIVDALEKCRWNKTHAAETLGISRRSLLYKLKAYAIQ